MKTPSYYYKAFATALTVLALGVSGCGNKPEDATAAQSTQTTDGAAKDGANTAGQQPALTVTTATPSVLATAQSITASGNVMAWQEASIGAQVPGLRLTSVRANVGDWVKKGQLLATFESSSVAAQTAELNASIAEAKVNLTEAQLNAARFDELEGTGAVSDYQISQARAQAKAAQERLKALDASKAAQAIRSDNTRVVAPDSGLISARSATVGAVVGTGAELFRLIRGGRLEWRGEVTASERAKLDVGMPVVVTSPSGLQVQTRIRALSPSLDPKTRKALIYADLPPSKNATGFAAGMYVKGTIATAERSGVFLPRQSVILRDGFYYVFGVRPDMTVQQVKVEVGVQQDGAVEITSPLPDDIQVVKNGAGFLNDGDLVSVLKGGQS